jgi:hypothetical protein
MHHDVVSEILSICLLALRLIIRRKTPRVATSTGDLLQGTLLPCSPHPKGLVVHPKGTLLI